jgi:protein-L-isoaspartate(D-aspartate) O-methyltransferase
MMTSQNGVRRAPDYQAACQAMVRDQLKRREISDSRVLWAMGATPRHLFVPPEWRAEAYSDRALLIGAGQTISQPYMVALMLQQLALQGTERVLEIGTGSGYQTALLCQLAAQVYSLKYVPELAMQAGEVLSQLGYQDVRIIVGDGGLGLPDCAPYDGILVAAAPKAPPHLLAQLANGGRLVVPIGTSTQQELRCITKHAEGYGEQRSVRCRFVLLRGQEGWT